MLKLQVLYYFLGFLSIIIYTLQPCECIPTFFQEYRKKRQKIREKRLKLSAAEIRLKDLNEKYHRRDRSEQFAEDIGVEYTHSNRSKWIKNDIKHVELNANVNRHLLAAKHVGVPEIRHALVHRAKGLQKKSFKLFKKKNELRRTGFNSDEMFDRNLEEDNRKYASFNDK